MNDEVKTTCPYCGVGCGVLARIDETGQVQIRGDKAHPANYGRLCSKGAALGETVDLDGRLLHPKIKGQRVSWDKALDKIADDFSRVIREHGPDAVAFYVSGQLLTEDYYVANKLMKGFIGSANIDTNSRLCMSSSVAGHKRAFGSDTVSGNYTDLEQANLVVLAGSNTAWCHPVLYQRIVAAKESRPELKVIVIDPRRTATCEIADLHLPLKPGSDTTLWNGLLHYIGQHGGVNYAYLEKYCTGYDDALMVAEATAPSIAWVANACGLKAADVEQFYKLFFNTDNVVSVYSQGVNQSSCGTDKVNAIINCHLLTGRIGRPGTGPFSLTGQPNAMGGREVGGLANQLAAHMDIDNAQHRALVQGFWGSPVIADKEGYKAVELFEAIGDGKIKAVWIMATNPVVSMPDADRVRAALERCDLIVVSDCMERTDTTECADILLPALAWGEKDGTVTNSERRISRQRPVMSAPGEAKADWWIITEVARRLGYESAFDYQTSADIFREHARLSAYENNGARDFDISGLAGVNDEQYETMAPVQWPVTHNQPGGTERLFSNGLFFTENKKARLISITPRLPPNTPDELFPLVLNTGRVRDHWHTMTRTGKSPRLSAHIAEPYIEIHPDDADRYGLKPEGLARVASRWGDMLGRVKTSRDQLPGSLFVPMHWNDQFAKQARIDAVVNPVVDPISGEPEFKHTPVCIRPYESDWYGFILSRRRLDLSGMNYFSSSIAKGYWCYEIAGEQLPRVWSEWARNILCTSNVTVEWIDYLDVGARCYRGARLADGGLESCVFISPTPQLPPRSWIAALFDQKTIGIEERKHLLSGRPGKGVCDKGRIVCACFGVGENLILEKLANKNVNTIDEIGVLTKAGTNCGSCIPEIKSIIHQVQSARQS